jgi:predicted O-methyltransferase YrrM
LRTIDELAADEIRKGFLKLRRTVQERMGLKDVEDMTPRTLVNPKSILEIGTYTGYSALCLAEGLQVEGKLHTIDTNEELHDFTRKYFNKSEYGNQIIQHTGNALSIIPKLNQTFDLIFIDADKEDYVKYFHLIIDKLNKGGIILSDNVLWSGKVIEPLNPKDEATKGVLEFNTLLKNDDRIETVLLPIRDGLTISRKKYLL